MKKYLTLITIAILITSLVFVFSQGDEIISQSFTGDELFDVTSIIGTNLEPGYISAQNVDVTKQGGVSTISFQKTKYEVPAGTLKIGDNSFDNIASTENKDSTLKLDESGNILEADFHMSNKGDRFILNDVEVFAPAGSHVIFDGDITRVIVPDGKTVSATHLEGDGKITFEGNDFLIRQPDGRDIWFRHGQKVHFNGINYFIEPGDSIDYKGLTFEPNKNVNLYFDGDMHDGPALSLGEKSFSFSCGEDPNIGKVLISGGYKDGYYNLGGLNTNKGWSDAEGLGRLDNMAQRDLIVGFTEPNSAIDFFGETNPLNSEIPTISCYGGYEIQTGTLNLAAKDGRVLYGRDSNQNFFSREIVIKDYTNEKYSRYMQIGQNSNIRFGIGDKESGFHIGGYEYGPMNNFNLKYFADSPEAFGTYDFGDNTLLKNEFIEKREYLLGAQNSLNDALIKKASSDAAFTSALNEYGGKVQLKDLDNFLTQIGGKDYYLDISERDSILNSAGYSDYTNIMESMRDMVPYYSTFGEKEGQVDILQQKYGVRQAFLQYFVSEQEILTSEEGKAAAEYANQRNRNPAGRIGFVQ